MARLPRLAIAGQPHLVVQRGLGPQPVFVDDIDRHSYLAALADASGACSVAIHAYVLMDDHVALLATPAERDALGRFMQRVGRRYVPLFNRRHDRSGRLWVGRFQATTVDPQHYLFRSIQLIEQAPVRAGLVSQAPDWPWSSAGHHVGRKRNAMVTEHEAYWRLGNTPFEREARHESELQQVLTDAQCGELLAAVRGGWPLGGSAFVALVAQATDRPVAPGPRGRPRRLTGVGRSF